MSEKEKIYGIIAKQLGFKVEDIEPDSKLEDTLGMDDLDGVELAMNLEEEFGIEISNEEWDAVKTAQDVVDLVLT